MKRYRIVRRDDLWHALGGDPEHSMVASDDRDGLTALARKLAARHAGEVHVYDEAGKLDVIYAYIGGRESLRYPLPPRVRIVRSVLEPEAED